MEPTLVINRNDRPNSFEFGKASLRHKVYYEDEADLKRAIDVALAGDKYLETHVSDQSGGN
jgi:hypothetical protein